MMYYAHVVTEAKELGFESDEAARIFARKIITTAALLAMMPEEVLQQWRDGTPEGGETGPVMEVMGRLDIRVPEKV